MIFYAGLTTSLILLVILSFTISAICVVVMPLYSS